MKKQISLLLTIVLVLSMVMSGMAFPTYAEADAVEVADVDGLKAAIAAAGAGDTIRFIDDIITDQTITVAKAITIDGNGYTFEYSGDGAAFNFTAAAADAPVIKDLSVVSSSLGVNVAGSAKLINCDFTTAKNVFGTATDGAVIDIDGGVYKTKGMIISSKHKITLNISDGYFGADGTFVVDMSAGVANIYGGYFKNTANISSAEKGPYRCLYTSGPDGTINTYGGIFDAVNVAARGDGGAITMYGGIFSAVRDGGLYGIAGLYKAGTPNMSVIMDNTANENYPVPVKTLDGVERSASSETYLPMFYGASVRLVEGSNGIRFTSRFSRAFIDGMNSLKDAGTEISYGTIIVPKDHVDGKVRFLTEAALIAAGLEEGKASGYAKIEAKNGIQTMSNGSIVLSAALVNLHEGNYDRDFYAVSYASFIRDGHTVTIYGLCQTTHNRSIATVAAEALADLSNKEKGDYVNETEDGKFSPYTEAQRAILKGYIK